MTKDLGVRCRVSGVRCQGRKTKKLKAETLRFGAWSLGFHKFALLQYSIIKNRGRLQGL